MKRRVAAFIAVAVLLAGAGQAGGNDAPGLRPFGNEHGFYRAGAGQVQLAIDGWNHIQIDHDTADGRRTTAVFDIWFSMLCPAGRPYTSESGVFRIPFKSPLPFIDCQPSYDGRFFVNRVPMGELAYRSRGWDGTGPAVWAQYVTYVDPDGIWFEIAISNGP